MSWANGTSLDVENPWKIPRRPDHGIVCLYWRGTNGSSLTGGCKFWPIAAAVKETGLPGLVNVYILLWKDPPFLMGKSTIDHHFQ